MLALASLTGLIRRALSFAAALTLVALLVIATLSSGKTYAWCVPMDRVPHGCCVPGAHVHPDPRAEASQTTSVRPECCVWKTVGDLPQAGARGADLDTIGPAPLAMTLPPPCLDPVACAAPSAIEKTSPSASVRYGPSRASPRSPQAKRASLQVFHC